jgi:hypothetical protein
MYRRGGYRFTRRAKSPNTVPVLNAAGFSLSRSRIRPTATHAPAAPKKQPRRPAARTAHSGSPFALVISPFHRHHTTKQAPAFRLLHPPGHKIQSVARPRLCIPFPRPFLSSDTANMPKNKGKVSFPPRDPAIIPLATAPPLLCLPSCARRQPRNHSPPIDVVHHHHGSRQ